MDIPKTKGYTCFVKIAESALEGDQVRARRYINKFIAMYPESDLIYPFQYLLNGIKNPDGLTLDQIVPLPSDDVCVAYGEGYEKGCEDTTSQSQSKPEPGKSAEDIAKENLLLFEEDTILYVSNGIVPWRILKAMEEYANQSQKMPTDEEIEEYANGLANPASKKDFERGEWLGIKEGARWMRDGLITKK